MKKNGAGPLLNFTEVAAILRKDVKTVRKWVAAGEHPDLTVRLGGQTYIRRSVLERLVTGPTEEAAAPHVPIQHRLDERRETVAASRRTDAHQTNCSVERCTSPPSPT